MRKIKIYEKKLIIENTNGVMETWEIGYGDTNQFIRYNGKVWGLYKSKKEEDI